MSLRQTHHTNRARESKRTTEEEEEEGESLAHVLPERVAFIETDEKGLNDLVDLVDLHVHEVLEAKVLGIVLTECLDLLLHRVSVSVRVRCPCSCSCSCRPLALCFLFFVSLWREEEAEGRGSEQATDAVCRLLAMNDFKTVLNELMGVDRNSLPNEKRNREHFWDDNVCKAFLCGFCPALAFANTKIKTSPHSHSHTLSLSSSFS